MKQDTLQALAHHGVIERNRAYLPVSAKTPVIAFHEGNTDLICARYLPDLLGTVRLVPGTGAICFIFPIRQEYCN